MVFILLEAIFQILSFCDNWNKNKFGLLLNKCGILFQVLPLIFGMLPSKELHPKLISYPEETLIYFSKLWSEFFWKSIKLLNKEDWRCS